MCKADKFQPLWGWYLTAHIKLCVGYLREALARCQAITARPFVAQGLQGPAVGEAMEKARLDALADLRAGQG